MSTEPTLTQQELDELDRLASAATPAPWSTRTAPADDSEETKAEYLAGSLSTDDPGAALYVLIADTDRDGLAYVLPAVTGDGPTSEANARFIEAARTAVPRLVAEVRELRAQVSS